MLVILKNSEREKYFSQTSPLYHIWYYSFDLLFITLFIIDRFFICAYLDSLLYSKLLEGRNRLCIPHTSEDCLERLKNSVNTCDELIETGH